MRYFYRFVLTSNIDSHLMEGNSSVTKLLLSGCSLTNKALQTLSEEIPGKLRRLCYLDLSSNDQLSSKCLSSICTLISLAGRCLLASVFAALDNLFEGSLSTIQALQRSGYENGSVDFLTTRPKN